MSVDTIEVRDVARSGHPGALATNLVRVLRRPWIRASVLIATDGVLWLMAMTSMVLLRLEFAVENLQVGGLLAVTLVAVAGQVLWGIPAGLYPGRRPLGAAAEGGALMLGSFLIGAGIVLWLFQIEGARPLPISVPAGAAAFFAVSSYSARLFVRATRERLAMGRRYQPRRAVIYGAGRTGREVARLLTGPGSEVAAVAFLDDDPARRRLRVMNCRVEGGLAALPAVVDRHGANVLVLAMTSASLDRVRQITATAEGLGISEIITFPGDGWQRTGFHGLGPNTHSQTHEGAAQRSLSEGRVSERDAPPPSLQLWGPTWLVKRTLDVVFSLFFLAVTAPIQLALMLAIRVDSPGPIFFRQERVGLHGRTFSLAKFRSMTAEAPKDLHRAHYETIATAGNGEGLRIIEDRRITRVGRFMRRWSLDELPNLWNVLIGDMSFVGPRPLVPYEVDLLPAWSAPRFEVRPGITGLAQINGRLDMSFHERLEWDLRYAQRFGLLQDLRILLATPRAVLRGRGV